jgi:cell division protein FtsW
MMYLALQGRLGRGETAANRVSNWYATILGNDKTEDLQATNAKFAIVSGGLIGKGPGRSDYRRTLTEANNDYIFAIVVEEYGLVGVLILLSVYMTLFFRVIRIIRKCEKSFQALLVSGLITLIMLQAMIHIGVSVGGIPVTGQNLPMISTGGTSIIITCASFGIILSISKETNYKRKSKRKIRKTTTVTNTATAN